MNPSDFVPDEGESPEMPTEHPGEPDVPHVEGRGEVPEHPPQDAGQGAFEKFTDKLLSTSPAEHPTDQRGNLPIEGSAKQHAELGLKKLGVGEDTPAVVNFLIAALKYVLEQNSDVEEDSEGDEGGLGDLGV